MLRRYYWRRRRRVAAEYAGHECGAYICKSSGCACAMGDQCAKHHAFIEYAEIRNAVRGARIFVNTVRMVHRDCGQKQCRLFDLRIGGLHRIDRTRMFVLTFRNLLRRM